MIRKIAMFTDIHYGKSNSSVDRLEDCLSYIKWFCNVVQTDPQIDAIMFLGDWHEHRSAINGVALDYSYKSAQILNELGLPIYFCIGNHDLYYRNTRDIFTTVIFENFENFILVDSPLELNDGKVVMAPYLFDHEYDAFFEKYGTAEVIAGHWEFKGFVVTGESRVMEHGPDPDKYSKPKRIFSGHFHKRQNKKNIYYIGNTFPMDFGDVNDVERGMAVYDVTKDDLKFINWEDCPKYMKLTLSEVIDDPKILQANSKVKITVDTELTFDESSKLKESLVKKYKLRELSLEEVIDTSQILSEDEAEINEMELNTTKEVIIEHLKRLKSDTIDNDTIIRIFEQL